MLNIVLDDRALHEVVVPCESILYQTSVGIGVRYGLTSSPAHCDQFLKVTAELGLSAETVVFPPGGRQGTLNDILRDSLQNFLIEQELEFTCVAYSRWLPPEDSWTNRFGETTTFDDLADALLKKPFGQGACNGTHVYYALVNLLRANEQHKIIGERTVGRIEQRLLDVSRRLEIHQAGNGAWFADWAGSGSELRSTGSSFEAIQATGHHLEWIALAPDRLRPSRQATSKAARFLAQIIPKHEFTTISHPRSYGAFSHAARALMLLQGVDAAHLIRHEDSTQLGRREGTYFDRKSSPINFMQEP